MKNDEIIELISSHAAIYLQPVDFHLACSNSLYLTIANLIIRFADHEEHSPRHLVKPDFEFLLGREEVEDAAQVARIYALITYPEFRN